MTGQKHLKQRIRARMEKTGERYATARHHIIGQPSSLSPEPPTSPDARWHLPGNIPATTALRVLLRAARHVPLSEAMLFGIAGGIGIGVFSFYYEREDIATFFVGGRHHWHDDRAYLVDALGRLSIPAEVQESGGARAAESQLREALEAHGPCAVWVDAAALSHRAMPGTLSGSSYHIITVYSIDAEARTARIGDLADEPITIDLDTLAKARARIKKDRHRLLSIPQGGPSAGPPLQQLVQAGLVACHGRLLHPALPGSVNNARLEALQTWAERMEGSKAKERWEHVYRPGPNLLRGLCAIHDFVEHYGTGGGLCRPIFAEFLREAADALGQTPLAMLAERYAELGSDWSELADAALPDDVGMLCEAKQLLTQKAELLHSGAPMADVQATWQRLGELEARSHEEFPLSNEAYRELRVQLRARIAALYEREAAALAELGMISHQ
jgi:hypothetical protein